MEKRTYGIMDKAMSPAIISALCFGVCVNIHIIFWRNWMIIINLICFFSYQVRPSHEALDKNSWISPSRIHPTWSTGVLLFENKASRMFWIYLLSLHVGIIAPSWKRACSALRRAAPWFGRRPLRGGATSRSLSRKYWGGFESFFSQEHSSLENPRKIQIQGGYMSWTLLRGPPS